MLGGGVPKIDRHGADGTALKHAVALVRDEIEMPDGCLTGREAYDRSTAALRDSEHLGEHFWHSNVVLNLRDAREAAAGYVRSVALGSSAPTKGRERLARLAERLVRLDAEAAVELEAARVATD